MDVGKDSLTILQKGACMTGKELIIYILTNNLESTYISDLSILFPNYYSIEQAAVKLETGVETIKALCKMKKLNYIEFDGKIYIYIRSEGND